MPCERCNLSLVKCAQKLGGQEKETSPNIADYFGLIKNFQDFQT